MGGATGGESGRIRERPARRVSGRGGVETGTRGKVGSTDRGDDEQGRETAEPEAQEDARQPGAGRWMKEDGTR